MSKDTKGQKIPKGKLEDVIKEWLIIQWSKDTKGEIRRRNQRMTDNTMVKRYQREIRNNQRRRNQRMTDNTMTG